MYQVRIHGRGGQGVTTCAALLSVAAFLQGRHALAFPSYDAEETGAPVTAFCRLDDRPIRLREPVVDPDVVIVQDPALAAGPYLFAGLRRRGRILFDSTLGQAEQGLADLATDPRGYRICRIPATAIAQRLLKRPLANTALLGAFAAITDEVRLESVVAAIRSSFAGPVAEGNVAAATEAFALARRSREAVHA